MKRHLAALPIALAAALLASHSAGAHGGSASLPVPAELRVTAAAPDGATDLKFSEMFKLPVGPKGLEASPKLLSLAGKTVRLVGYIASEELPTPGQLILAPLPVALGDEDESLSDDLPASAVFVHLSSADASAVVPNLLGLLQLVGTLEVGPRDEPDGHVSTVRLLLESAASQRLLAATSATPGAAMTRSATSANANSIGETSGVATPTATATTHPL